MVLRYTLIMGNMFNISNIAYANIKLDADSIKNGDSSFHTWKQYSALKIMFKY